MRRPRFSCWVRRALAKRPRSTTCCLALRAGHRVLFETRERRFYFDGDVVQSEIMGGKALMDYRDDEKVLLLVDPYPAPPFCHAFTVAAMAPDPKAYKEWVKNDCAVLQIPPTTKHEVIAMNSVEQNVEPQELENRIAKYGPIPRYVLNEDQDFVRAVFSIST